MPPVDLPSRVFGHLAGFLQPGDRLVVALSGGPDSVALAHALRGSPYKLVLAHIDHGLRPDSARDARFVRRLAQVWDLPFRLKRVKVKSFAKRHRLGIEEAAREQRYAALEAIARATHARAVVTAHTQDDQAETVLMNFLRGAGGPGLAGMPPRRRLGSDGASIQLLRPLLDTPRAEVLDYLRVHNLRFKQDPTNRLKKFTRNRLRHETLPYLDRLFPGLSTRLAQTAAILRDEEAHWAEIVSRELAKTVRKDKQRTSIDLTVLFRYHKALGRRILRYFLPGSSFQDIERVFRAVQVHGGGRRLQLSNGFDVECRAGKLWIHPVRPGDPVVERDS